MLSDWVDQGNCSASCGGGRQGQVRSVLVPPAHGGACSQPLYRTVPCNSQTCPADCVLGPWKDASKCSETCGGGGTKVQRRDVLTPAAEGGTCAARERIVPCNEQACPVDCTLGPWEDDGVCSKSCGGGFQLQSRVLLSPARHGGQCPPRQRRVACNSQPCALNCTLGAAWKDASPCSQACGDGIKVQVREVERPALNGGVCDASELHRFAPCHLRDCPTSCEMSEWKTVGQCTKSCGGGKIRQVRSVKTPAAHGGQCHEAVEQWVPCSTQACPVGCKLGPWVDTEACSQPCGGGMRLQTRAVVEPAQHGGNCSATERHVPCNSLAYVQCFQRVKIYHAVVSPSFMHRLYCMLVDDFPDVLWIAKSAAGKTLVTARRSVAAAC